MGDMCQHVGGAMHVSLVSFHVLHSVLQRYSVGTRAFGIQRDWSLVHGAPHHPTRCALIWLERLDED